MLNPQVNRRPVSRLRRATLAVILAAITVPIAAATAAMAGAPSGVLRDPMGRVLPGAVVRLSAIGSEAVHETASDANGAFQFGEVPDGDYLLSARLPGFNAARQPVRVSAAMAPLDITLQVGTLRETVTIRGGQGQAANQPVRSTTTASSPTAPRCGNAEVGGNLKPPRKLKDVRPRYKQEWAASGVTGKVLLQATIGVDGKIRHIEVVSPVNAELEEEAMAAVSQWEFSPTWLNCEPIEVRMFVTASFELEQ